MWCLKTRESAPVGFLNKKIPELRHTHVEEAKATRHPSNWIGLPSGPAAASVSTLSTARVAATLWSLSAHSTWSEQKRDQLILAQMPIEGPPRGQKEGARRLLLTDPAACLTCLCPAQVEAKLPSTKPQISCTSHPTLAHVWLKPANLPHHTAHTAHTAPLVVAQAHCRGDAV